MLEKNMEVFQEKNPYNKINCWKNTIKQINTEKGFGIQKMNNISE